MAESSCSGTAPYKQLIGDDGSVAVVSGYRLVSNQSPLAAQPFNSRPVLDVAEGQPWDSFLVDGPMRHMSLSSHQGTTSLSEMPVQSPAGRPHGTEQVGPRPNPIAVPTPAPSSWVIDFAAFSNPNAIAGGPQQSLPSIRNVTPQALTFPQLSRQRQPAILGLAPQFKPPVGDGSDALKPATAPMGAEEEFDIEMNKWMAYHGETLTSESRGIAEEMVGQKVLQDMSAGPEAMSKTMMHTTNPGLLADASGKTHPATEDGQCSREDREAVEPTPPSAVSEAARLVLETVRHEAGEKWKNSNFLSLMRDFRDGKKDIVGTEIRIADAVQQTPS